MEDVTKITLPAPSSLCKNLRLALTPLNASETDDLGCSITVRLLSWLFFPITPKRGILVALTTSFITLILLSNNSASKRIINGINSIPNISEFLIKAVLGAIGPCPRFLASSITDISETFILSLISASESLLSNVL